MLAASGKRGGGGRPGKLERIRKRISGAIQGALASAANRKKK